MKSKKGFTLVEMVVAIAIVAIMAAATVSGVGMAIDRARTAKTMQSLQDMQNVISQKMMEAPYTMKIKTADLENLTDIAKEFINSVNNEFSAEEKVDNVDFRPDTATVETIGNITIRQSDGAVTYKMKKTDAWGNPYLITFLSFRNNVLSDHPEQYFCVEVRSAGPNSKARSGYLKNIEADDLFLVVANRDNTVLSEVVNCANRSDFFDPSGINSNIKNYILTMHNQG